MPQSDKPLWAVILLSTVSIVSLTVGWQLLGSDLFSDILGALAMVGPASACALTLNQLDRLRLKKFDAVAITVLLAITRATASFAHDVVRTGGLPAGNCSRREQGTRASRAQGDTIDTLIGQLTRTKAELEQLKHALEGSTGASMSASRWSPRIDDALLLIPDFELIQDNLQYARYYEAPQTRLQLSICVRWAKIAPVWLQVFDPHFIGEMQTIICYGTTELASRIALAQSTVTEYPPQLDPRQCVATLITSVGLSLTLVTIAKDEFHFSRKMWEKIDAASDELSRKLRQID